MGTPIPKRENESKAAMSSEVTTYCLSDEELAKYRAMPAPKKGKKPIGVRIADRDVEEKQRRAKMKDSKGDSTSMTAEKQNKEDKLDEEKEKKPLRERIAQVNAELNKEIERLHEALKTAKQENERLESQMSDYERCALKGWDMVDELNRDIVHITQERDEYKRSYDELVKTNEAVERAEGDAVERPTHYTVGGIETIDYIRAKLTPEEFQGYCKGNALKYISRSRMKGGKEDLLKAAKYLAFAAREE